MPENVVLSARVCSSNAEQFPELLDLHVPRPARVLDMTYGRGVFWQKVEGVRLGSDDLLRGRGPSKRSREYWVFANDLDPERGTYHYDFTRLPADWGDTFDACVLDPPYLGVGGIKTLKESIDRGYSNKGRAEAGFGGISGTRRLYAMGICEAWRVLKRSGILIVKTMDQVESGQLQFLSHDIMELLRILGFRVVDEMLMVNASAPTMRHPPEAQRTSRHNYSNWIVARRRP